MAFPRWDFSHGPVRLSDSCFPVEGTLGLLRMHFLLAWASDRANPSLTHSCIHHAAPTPTFLQVCFLFLPSSAHGARPSRASCHLHSAQIYCL